MQNAKLIVLEGNDGSGKSTQVELIKKYFEEKRLTYSFYHFPMYGHNYFSKVIEKFLQGDFGTIDEVDPLFVATQYAMDRYTFLPELKKEMEEKDVVLLDRYVFSNIAFQCAKLKNPEESHKLRQFIVSLEFDFLGLPYPDLNIFFDVPVNFIKSRLEQRNKEENREYLQGKQDIHESDMDFQGRVRLEYLNAMTGTHNCQIILCTRPVLLQASGTSTDFTNIQKALLPEEIFDQYKENINSLLNLE